MDQQLAHGSPPAPPDDILGGVGSAPAPSHTGRAWAWFGSIVVVLAGLYVGAQWYVSDRVPHGTTVAGVDIGGMNVEQAQARLTSDLADAQTEPVRLTVAGKKATLDPKAAGLRVDVPATVAPLASFSLQPARLWHAVVGVDDVQPAVTDDTAGLDAQIAKIAGAVDVAPVDGSVAFVEGSATSTAPRDGRAVERARSRAAITGHWLTSSSPIALPTRAVHPDVGTKGTEDGLVLAGTVASAPVDVVVGSTSVRLPGDVVAKAASFEPDGSALSVTMDGSALRADVVARSKRLVKDPENASFTFVKGKPKIEAGKSGTSIDPSKLAATVAAAAAKSSNRTAKVALTTVEPTTGTADLKSLGIRQVVSHFSTNLTPEPIRTENLVLGAKKLTGRLVKPGKTFSILDALAPITKAGGYHDAHMIIDGAFVEATGGGLSQAATTTYNAAYFAGLTIVTHKPHSYYFPRYPVGREATIAVPSIDMKFTDDAPTGILIRSWVKSNRFHVQFWGTPYYTVKSKTGPRRDVVQPTTIDSSSASCVPVPAGSAGFSIKVRRVVSLHGKKVKDETNSWRYLPENRIVCSNTSGGSK